MKHLQRDLESLKKEILNLGSLVISAIDQAIHSLNGRRLDLAQNVMAEASAIDDLEVKIEEDCLKILALHTPVAVDLRFIVVVLKINNDLERMGDFAVNVAKRAIELHALPPLSIEVDLEKMGADISFMVHKSLESLVHLDLELAREVIDKDDDVDDANRAMYTNMQSLMKADPENVERAVQMLSCSRYLERIADLATNLCEDVIFIVEGEVIRHQ